ncbi:hypothetical protein DL93DRAFT_2081028 [Clavulina sp. PMI_390]|nr:hypothetical protein DL93DRAFT_2081028 [Clavulina sp. PMI_390]
MAQANQSAGSCEQESAVFSAACSSPARSFRILADPNDHPTMEIWEKICKEIERKSTTACEDSDNL